jgi:hypothetical protein
MNAAWEDVRCVGRRGFRVAFGGLLGLKGEHVDVCVNKRKRNGRNSAVKSYVTSRHQ